MPPTDSAWQERAISAEMASTLADLQARSLLASFYLAGGTALALQFGHRRSVDLDFFSADTIYGDQLIQSLLGLEGFAVVAQAPETLHVAIRAVQVSFLGYRYPVLYPFADWRGVALADPRDIACMKVTAIASRGTKRDFIDLYESARRLGGLRPILEWFDRKYAAAHYSTAHILKSLTFFADAEKDPMPDMLIPCGWDEVKRFFSRRVPPLL